MCQTMTAQVHNDSYNGDFLPIKGKRWGGDTGTQVILPLAGGVPAASYDGVLHYVESVDSVPLIETLA